MTATREDKIIEDYLSLILEQNKNVNLTRICSAREAHLLHIEDSLTALEEMNAAPAGVYGDLGTGGGFPGVPLAIKTGRETVLIESIKKKADIVKRAIEEVCESDRIKVYNGRAEQLAAEKPNSFAVLTARAVGKLPTLLKLASPLLQEGGHLICYKAHVSEEEENGARTAESALGMSLFSRRKFVLSDGETFRELRVYEKTAPAQ